MAAYKGVFKPKNPHKYKGEVSNIIYRSSWELRFMSYCDTHPQIIKWSSEEISINYLSPKTRKFQRYFPDFLIQVKNKNNSIDTILIEIKPFHETQPPTNRTAKKAKSRGRLLKESITFAVNQAKWAAATEWCRKRNIQFKVLTEKELNL